MEKVNVNDLNGLEAPAMKLITKIVQEANSVKFSALCEELIKTIHPEIMLSYQTSAMPTPTPSGMALVFVAIVQYWATEEEFKTHLDELKRASLIIKP